MAAVEPSPCSSLATEDNFSKEEVASLLAKGKRHYVCQEAALACSCFEEASSLLASHYGQTSEECGEAYLYYGKSLLDLARLEGGVFGSALEEGKPSTCDDADKDEEIPVEEANGEGASNGIDAEEDANESDEEEENDREEACEDVPNMQLAWEMVELAKSILSRNSSKESQLKLADCLATLGEISLELEHYSEAVEDFENCLKIRKEHLNEDDREIAEMHYQLGLSTMFEKDFKKSLQHFNEALVCIKLRAGHIVKAIDELEQDIRGKQKVQPDSAIEKLRRERADLESLIPEITAKIDDVQENEKSNAAAISAVQDIARQFMGQAASNPFDCPEFPSSANENSTKSEPATDISHLVRKKDTTLPEPATDISNLVRKKDSTAPEPAADISHLIRKKRMPDEEVDEGCDVKRSKAS